MSLPLLATWDTEAMRVICAWCTAVMVDGPVDAPVSHGICDPCAAKVEAEDGEGRG